MGDAPASLEEVLKRIRAQAAADNFRITQHAQQEMVEEEISLDETLEAIAAGQIIEYYSEHRRGACCLVSGQTRGGRPIHMVCTTTQPVLIIITVYQPRSPKWVTPTERRREK